ncbi:unnamed protein product [Toxocara canis]|uniref:ShKT domain-containing protein n=1 Tax=Toxocara canis TaxID=6265 RepID=A0A183U6Z3_TOXCA|nr:unnamed protein product [Toxocara canis]
MKILLLISFATVAFAAEPSKDVVIKQCAVSVGGVQRPSVAPSLCKNTYADVPCSYLYPVSDNSSHSNASENFLVSNRCYSGPLQPYAKLCSSQCALCCEEPEYNCTDSNV